MASPMTTPFRPTAGSTLVLLILAAKPAVAQAPPPPDTSAVLSTDSVTPPADSVILLAPRPMPVAAVEAPIHPTVAPSPDGRMFAAIQTRPDPILWIVPADGSEPYAFRKMWAAYYPRWSPSGDRLGFIAAIGPPRVWTVELDLETGRPIDPPRLLIYIEANAFAFSPDGTRIALVAARSTAAGASELHIIDWETRSRRRLLRERGSIYRLDWAPDGRSIYYGLLPFAPSPEAPHRVKKVSVASGAADAVRDGGEFLGLAPNGEWLLQRVPADSAGSESVVEVVALDDGQVTRIRLPSGIWSVSWAGTSDALVLVAPIEDEDGIWQIPIKPVMPEPSQP
jgi:dipeptidyl aminopeptidase/acylaminoacyl peptidase